MIDPEFPFESRHPSLRERLAASLPLLAVELRPPRRALEGVHAMEAWIDVHHTIRKLSAGGTVVFLTDNAVGSDEEENLTHLVRNLGEDAVRGLVVPFLTLKHPLRYCESYAARARREGFPALVVLGGDRHDGIPRCLPHAFELRTRLRASQPALLLGGWANPYRDPVEQLDFLEQQAEGLDFVLTQVMSHHQLAPAQAFVHHFVRRGLDLPLIGGVFYYRSARRRTLRVLDTFIPVPAEGLTRDFHEHAFSADEVCAATLRALASLGLTRFYISNLPTASAAKRLAALRRLAGL